MEIEKKVKKKLKKLKKFDIIEIVAKYGNCQSGEMMLTFRGLSEWKWRF